MLDGIERERRERHENEEVMEHQSRYVLYALGVGWGLELRESQALELGSLERVGSQEEFGHLHLEARTPLPVRDGMVGCILHSPPHLHTYHCLILGRVFFMPFSFELSCATILANVLDA